MAVGGGVWRSGTQSKPRQSIKQIELILAVRDEVDIIIIYDSLTTSFRALMIA